MAFPYLPGGLQRQAGISAEADGDALVRPADPANEPDARLAILEEAEFQAVLPEDLFLGGVPQRDVSEGHTWLLPRRPWCQITCDSTSRAETRRDT
jgi:hypothetical protein